MIDFRNKNMIRLLIEYSQLVTVVYITLVWH